MKDMIERYYRDNFNKLVKAYTRRAGSVENAEDIIQEAFFLALKYSDSYDERYCNFKAWFDRIALNAFRLKMREERMMGMSEEVKEEMLEQDDASLFSAKLLERIDADIAKKPPHIAEVLNLHFKRQYGPKQITEITGIAYKTVQMTVLRFKQDMKERYGEGGIR